jgi:hypothetical protein
VSSPGVYEGNVAEALNAIERQRTFAAKESLLPTVIGIHEQAAFILTEAGDLAGSAKHIDAASRLVAGSPLPWFHPTASSISSCCSACFPDRTSAH